MGLKIRSRDEHEEYMEKKSENWGISTLGNVLEGVVRGAVAFYTAGLSEVGLSQFDSAQKNQLGQVGGAIGSAASSFGGGNNVTGSSGPETSKIDTSAVSQASEQMSQPIIKSQMPNAGEAGKQAAAKSPIKKVFSWMQENPELTKIIGTGISSMFTPDEIDIMRERAKLASRNYDGGGIVNMKGRSGSFGQRADQERSAQKDEVRGGYKESSSSRESVDPYVGAGERDSSFDAIQQQRYNTDSQQYFDSLRKNRGVLRSRMRTQ